MGTWNFRTMITGLTNHLLGVNKACKAVAIDKERSRLNMDKKISFPSGKASQQLDQSAWFWGLLSETAWFFPCDRRNWTLSISSAPLLQWACQSHHCLLTQARLPAETKHRSYRDLSHHRKYPRGEDHVFTRRLQCTSGYQPWLLSLLSLSFWKRINEWKWTTAVGALFSPPPLCQRTSAQRLSIITECPGYTPDQIIGIKSTTSLHGELSYPV